MIERGDVPAADTQLGNRIAFSASLMSGLGVTEFAPRSSAAAEISDLAHELFERLGLSARNRRTEQSRARRSAADARLH